MNSRQCAILMDHDQNQNQNRPTRRHIDEEIMPFIKGLMIIAGFMFIFSFQMIISYAISIRKGEI
jgi:hypothetical protein